MTTTVHVTAHPGDGLEVIVATINPKTEQTLSQRIMQAGDEGLFYAHETASIVVIEQPIRKPMTPEN